MTTEDIILELAESRWGKKSMQGVALKLAEEAGEVAGALIKLDERRADIFHVDEELSHVAFVLSQLAAKRGTTLKALQTAAIRQFKFRHGKQGAS